MDRSFRCIRTINHKFSDWSIDCFCGVTDWVRANRVATNVHSFLSVYLSQNEFTWSSCLLTNRTKLNLLHDRLPEIPTVWSLMSSSSASQVLDLDKTVPSLSRQQLWLGWLHPRGLDADVKTSIKAHHPYLFLISVSVSAVLCRLASYQVASCVKILHC